MDDLYHHGIKGMKWGRRRWQNNDGSLNSAGKKRYDADGLAAGVSKKAAPAKKTTPTKKTAPVKKTTPAKKTAKKKVNKDKESINRMIKALDDQMKAQKVSALSSIASKALQARGQSSAASILDGFGRGYASSLSAQAGYDFWRS